VLLLFVFWSLNCCSLSFCRCIVALCVLVVVLLLFVSWSLYCCSLSLLHFYFRVQVPLKFPCEILF
jgi:hypothetical protein